MDLSENAIAWLEVHRQYGGRHEGPIVDYDERTLRMRREQNRIAAGIAHWPNSAMRHSYCSYWLAMHRDISELAYSPDTVQSTQCGDTTEAEAKKFWTIMPPLTASNVVRMTGLRYLGC